MKNFKPYKGRQLDEQKKVKVYRNLNNGKISVMQSGLVIGHCDKIILGCAKFIVSEAGRQRVIKEGRKNVHAFITGYVSGNLELSSKRIPVTYNPYRYDSFVKTDSEDFKLSTAGMVSVSSNGWIFIDGSYSYGGEFFRTVLK